MRPTVAALVVLAGILSACTTGAGSTPAPRDGRSGLQGTGTVAGRQVAVSMGLPDLVVGDCDPIDGRDDDVCFIADRIGGETFVLLIENPAVLDEGVTLPVVHPDELDCGDPGACDAVTGAAVVALKLGTGPALHAIGGRLTIERLVPYTNYRGDFTLQLPDGRFSGRFDVVPRPD